VRSVRQVPSREDWGDLNVDPELGHAYRLFGGKSVEEAMPLFAENPVERAAELRFTPTAVFNYYLFCFIDFLLSPGAAGAADAASCFLRLLRDRMRADPAVAEGYPVLRPAIDAVSERQGFYDADVDIYGAFPDLRQEMEALHASADSHDGQLAGALEIVEIRDCYGDVLVRYPVAHAAAGLRGALLEGAELSWAELAGRDLEGSDLYWARLFQANLEHANLRGADLRGADLKEANLCCANLEGANLGRDNLGGATSLQGANLEGARLSGARLAGATYDDRTRFPPDFSPDKAGMVKTPAGCTENAARTAKRSSAPSRKR
jgi:hypothetical protein